MSFRNSRNAQRIMDARSPDLPAALASLLALFRPARPPPAGLAAPGADGDGVGEKAQPGFDQFDQPVAMAGLDDDSVLTHLECNVTNLVLKLWPCKGTSASLKPRPPLNHSAAAPRHPRSPR